MSLRLGIDVGAVTVKLAALDGRGRLVWGRWRAHLGQPLRVLAALLEELGGGAGAAAVTGSGRRLVEAALAVRGLSEIRAQAEGALAACPNARTVIEIGGQDSKLIRLAAAGGRARILDQAMNDLCAAGTGAFLERQAQRLGLPVEEFGELARGAGTAAAVAGRCAVFAQTDVAHLRRQGRPVAEVASGLCLALARNFLGTLGRGQALEPPVTLQGGVAANAGVRAAFGRLLGREPLVPEHYRLTGAIGAALVAGNGDGCSTLVPAQAAQRLRQFAAPGAVACLPALAPVASPPALLLEAPGGQARECFVGIDIGSVSAKVAAIDPGGRLLYARWREAGGEAAAEADRLLAEVRGLGLLVRAVAVTGSGRRAAAQATGAVAINEIRAQARAARELVPEARTVIEIGGQDAKLIGLEAGGRLRDFEMNRVCAAGTGAFLEEQAARLGLRREELGRLALQASQPPRLGTRCTVFMESDLVHHQQRGLPLEGLAAGLCYAAAANYLEKVAAGRDLDPPVAFLGGLAANPGVVAAFSGLLGQPVTVPAAHKVSGALGAALILRDEAGRSSTGEVPGRSVDLFAERERLVFAASGAPHRLAAGLPRALLCHRHYPFWARLFAALGLGLALSPETDEAILGLARQSAPVETCLPVRLAYGHAACLLAAGVETLLLPVVKEEAQGRARAYRCPYVQTLPHLLAHRFGARTLAPLMPRSWERRGLVRALTPLGAQIGVGRAALGRAVAEALSAQGEFEARWRERGRAALRLAEPQRSVLVLAREYLTGDAATGGDVPRLLAAAGLEPLPHELAALEAAPAQEQGMVWRRGQDFFRAARWAAGRGLHALMLTSFGCGPDSFLEKYLRAILGDRLCVIELDEHATRAALETRVEAFADQVRGSLRHSRRVGPVRETPRVRLEGLRRRKVWVPYAGEPFHALVAALKWAGIEAEMLPAPDAESEALGRRHCSGKECLPFLYHAGDLGRLAERLGEGRARSAAVFVPGNDESCRVSQYGRALRLLLDGLGMKELMIFSPQVSMESDEAVDLLGLRFGRRLWRGWVAIEALGRRRLQVRPYEVSPGDADAAYERGRQLIAGAISGGGRGFWAALREALRLLSCVPQRRRHARPRIGVIGDYYLRANEFASRGLVRRIEALGGEAVVAPFFTDYIRFQARERPRLLWRAGRPLSLAGSLVRAAGLRHDYARIATIAGLDDPGPAECLRAARPFLGPEVDRPVVASLGELAHFRARALAGIVNPVPLHCLYGTIATSAALAYLRGSRLPLLTLTYDGQEETNLQGRLEAFMDQVLSNQPPGTEGGLALPERPLRS